MDQVAFDETDFKVHRRYDLNEVNKYLLMADVYCQYPVPTECVVTETRLVTPVQARVYRTMLTLPAEQNPEKTFTYYPRVLLVEVWEDCGDDGHTEMRLAGFAFFADAEINEYRRQAEKGEVMNEWGMKATVHRLVELAIHKQEGWA